MRGAAEGRERTPQRPVDPAHPRPAVAKEVARGNLEVDAKTRSRDAIGLLLAEMDGMVTDLKGMSLSSESIAKGDLTADVTPRSEEDRLGIALRDMTLKLREVISNASVSATYVAEGVSNMSATAEQLSAGPTSRRRRPGRPAPRSRR